MPSLFIPRRSDAHRLACLALYKALLRQCGRLGKGLNNSLGPGSNGSNGPNGRASVLQELVRYRFRRDERLHSFTAIAQALERGRAQLRVLDEANRGSATAAEALVKTIEATVSHTEAEAEARQQQRLSRQQIKSTATTTTSSPTVIPASMQLQPPPDSVPLKALPLPLSQLRRQRRRRMVPSLSESQARVGILRWPGQHQFPAWVARVMRQKIKRFETMHEKRMDLEYWANLGRYEDAWDRIVRRRDPDSDIYTWSSEASGALAAQEAVIRRVEAERGERGKFLWTIVKKEQKLSDWETIPERAVQTAKRMAGIHLNLVRLAKRWGKHRRARRLFASYQRRRQAYAQAAEELTSMYWEIPVEWVKNIQPVTSPTSASTSSRLNYTQESMQMRPAPSRQNPRPTTTGATTTTGKDKDKDFKPLNRPPYQYKNVRDLKQALDTVRLIDVDKTESESGSMFKSEADAEADAEAESETSTGPRLSFHYSRTDTGVGIGIRTGTGKPMPKRKTGPTGGSGSGGGR